jgi:hypothetical protein
MEMLKNLNEVALLTRQQYRDGFIASEFVLPENFKEIYGASLRENGQTVDYTAHTAIITTAGNLKMYIPNQWFRMATFTVEYIKVFNQYRTLLLDVLSMTMDQRERLSLIKELKERKDLTVIANFKDLLSSSFEGSLEGFEKNETIELLTRFTTDYGWWYGNKTIDRHDSYYSPVLSLLEVVNASQSYIAEISYKFATDPSFGVVVDELMHAEHIVSNNVIDSTSGFEQLETQRKTGGINEIIYGAPGTGKSKYVVDKYENKTVSTRVVFHPDYSVFDFIGSYKPVPLYKETDTQFLKVDRTPIERGEPWIDYQFVPGPFINCLVKALLNPAQMHTLIIEEINRSNAASVFGEIFQLLDRDINGTSEYCITPSEELSNYLGSIPEIETLIRDGLRIPSNMNLVATMNSADQGVMQMDSAFKRRWSFKYIGIDIENAVHSKTNLRYAGLEVEWGSLVKSINSKLTNNNFGEDRLIGPYFIKPNEVGERKATDKLLLYLWDDVLRYNRDSFFSSRVKSFSDLTNGFEVEDVLNLSAGKELLIAKYSQTESSEMDDEDEDVMDEEDL